MMWDLRRPGPHRAVARIGDSGDASSSYRRPVGGDTTPSDAQSELANLEFERIITRLVEQGREVPSTQGRLHSLLRANEAIIGELSLPVALRGIVEAACRLVDAPYGALGVLAADRQGLEEFIHVGIDDATAAQIGHLPHGKGLLGALIVDDPHPIRLRDLTTDSRSVGFPEHHPPMRGFLDVPIRSEEHTSELQSPVHLV